MDVLSELKSRFRPALAALVDNPTDLLEMIRPAQDPKFGDYQANCAMPLGKQVKKPPREVAAEIVAKVDLDDICDPPEIAGPGFINLRLKDDWIVNQLVSIIDDDRLGIQPVAEPKTYVIDYSSPNVAKPMHVGHIRSTVIGDAIARTLRFLGHKVIGDNHLGDWGTQFGMIIYGYKHFVEKYKFAAAPVDELGRLYKLVNQLIDYHNAKKNLPKSEQGIVDFAKQIADKQAETNSEDKSTAKNARKQLAKLVNKICEACTDHEALKEIITTVESSPDLTKKANQHKKIGDAVLQETAKLHAGDEENLRLWNEFLPICRDEIQRVYDRLDIKFDVEYGESFYHDQLATVVQQLQDEGFARTSDGAVCVFLDGFDAPMIIQKSDGAFLYATTDLATIQFRMKTWQPDALLYVVDHRQSDHFKMLFAAARLFGFQQVEYRHIGFGKVLGNDGKPYRTRSGDTVGLEGLLDEAVSRARTIVNENGPELAEEDRKRIAAVVGHAAIKYADLSHNRDSDYKFDEDKMVAMEGNTGTYMQYSFARIQSIIAKGNVTIGQIRSQSCKLILQNDAERALSIELLRFGQAVSDSVEDYRPNQMTDYLFSLAKSFSRFFETCPVLKAESDELRSSRLLLCDLTARTLKQGLSLLGISVVDKM